MKASLDINFENSTLEELYNSYENKMYGIAYSILNNVGQAEDAVHDAFIKLIPFLESIDRVTSIKTKRLVTYTIKNVAIDIYRKNKKESELFIKGVEESLFTENKLEVNSVKNFEDRQLVVQLFSNLSPKYREIIRYHCYYELSYKEISEILNISEKAAAKRYERARKLLKEMVQKEMKGDELYG